MKDILLFSFLLFLIGCKTKEQKEVAEFEPKQVESTGVNVLVTVVEDTTFQKQIITNGVVETNKSSELRFNASNYVRELYVRNGSYVKEGQLIARLNDNEQQEKLEQAQTALNKANNELYVLKVERGYENTEEKEIPQTLLQTLKVRSGLAEAEDLIDQANQEISRTYLYAPFSGRVADLKVRTNDFITPADIFCSLIGGSGKMVTFQLLESEIPFVQTGQTITAQLFNQESSFTGKIVEINPKVDENGLITARANLNQASKLYDGMNMKIFINEPVDDYVVIPKPALVLRSNRDVVFTYENGLAKWNYVKVADENSESYALAEGVSVGDTIIISGNLNLSHDAKVNISDSN